MTRLPVHNYWNALTYAPLLLLVAFIWAEFVANIPSLRVVSGIPYVVHNPVVAVPNIGTWTLMAYIFARRYLASAPNPAGEGLAFGLVLAGAALTFDVVVAAGIVGEGLHHFHQILLWITYALLIIIPWWIGRMRYT